MLSYDAHHTPRIVITGKEALDRKAMHREDLRLQRARRKEIEKQTLRDRLEHEQEERARAERDKRFGILPANWDRVMERERIRLLVAQAEAAKRRLGRPGERSNALQAGRTRRSAHAAAHNGAGLHRRDQEVLSKGRSDAVANGNKGDVLMKRLTLAVLMLAEAPAYAQVPLANH